MLEEIMLIGNDTDHEGNGNHTNMIFIIALAACGVITVTSSVGACAYWCFKKMLGGIDGNQGLFEKNRSPKRRNILHEHDRGHELNINFFRDVTEYQIKSEEERGGFCCSWLTDCCSSLSSCCWSLWGKGVGFFQLKNKRVVSSNNLPEILRVNDTHKRMSIRV